MITQLFIKGVLSLYRVLMATEERDEREGVHQVQVPQEASVLVRGLVTSDKDTMAWTTFS